MNKRSPQHLKLEALKRIDRLLAIYPDLIEERYQRACLLEELGRPEEAKTEFLEVLKRAPTHFGTLIRFGNLLYAKGLVADALILYREAVKRHPSNPVGYVNLANVQAQNNEPEQARLNFEAALRIDPDYWAANRGMAYLLTDSRDEQNAKRYRDKAFGQNPLLHWPSTGEKSPVNLLMLVSAMGGLVRFRHHLDSRVFEVTELFVEYFDPSQPLPPHQKVVNAIGNADVARSGLEIAVKLLEKTSAPVLNHPSRVLPTGREEVLKKLGTIPGVITPRTSLVSREKLMSPQVGGYLDELGFSFPFLLRSAGFQGGRHFIQVENEEALQNQLPTLPGEELLAIQFLDARSPDGKIRKYRVMMIDGKLYPLHAAISRDWKIHFFSADMADNPENREEDLRFLNRMPEVLGNPAMEALEKICSSLGLDYSGADFSLNAKGEILLFEANATMVVNPPETDPKWDYRRPAVQKVLQAIQQMFRK